MPFNAIDTTSLSGALLRAPSLIKAGIRAVGGYYFLHGSKELLTADAARSLTRAGLSVFSILENGFPWAVGYFTEERGEEDGHLALSCARAAQQPTGKTIWFTVDYDAQEKDLPAITDYFGAARVVLHPEGYPLSVYGNGLVCAHLKQLGLVKFTWLSGSHGFAGYQDWLPSADIVQTIPGGPILDGLNADYDTFAGDPDDYGCWRLA